MKDQKRDDDDDDDYDDYDYHHPWSNECSFLP
jgi:hypothetical protein